MDCEKRHYVHFHSRGNNSFATVRPIKKHDNSQRTFKVQHVNSSYWLVTADGKAIADVDENKDIRLFDCNHCLVSLSIDRMAFLDRCFTMRRKSKPGTCLRFRKGITGTYLSEISTNVGKCEKLSLMTKAQYWALFQPGEFC